MRFSFRLTAAFFCALVLIHAGTTFPARADGIQLLPPVESSTFVNGGHPSSDDVCKGSVTGKMLTWDGQNPIKCISTITVDTNSNVAIGTTRPQQKLTVTSGDSAVVNIYTNSGVGKIDAVDPSNPAQNRWLSINPSGGNVGIGTSRPQATLDIENGNKTANMALNGNVVHLFGGMYQTYICDTAGNLIPAGNGIDGGCRISNPVTHNCSCASGFTPYRINDFNSGVCPQLAYENRGMIEYYCMN